MILKVNYNLKLRLLLFKARKFFFLLARIKRLITSLYNKDKTRLYKIKKIRAFLVKVSKVKTISNIDILEIGFTIIILENKDIKVNILILRLYKVVINNTIYR